MTGSLLRRIVEEREGMGAAERRVAEHVAAHPGEVMHMSMAKLSALCGVSDPTIMRFCRRFGCEGYQDLKLKLAQTLVPSPPFEYERIVTGDPVAAIARKTCRNSLAAIQRFQDDLDPDQIARAAEAIRAAAWVAIHSSGLSEVTAVDAEHKLQRLGVRCAALVGRKKQAMHAASARPGELALIFSQSGHTRQMVEIAAATRAGGGRALSVTAADSPLSEVSDDLVAVRPYDHTELMTPLASRLNHHLVVNMLVTAIAMSGGSRFPDQLPALDSWRTDKI